MSVPTLPLGEVFEVQLGKMLDAKGNRGEPHPYLANRNVQWDRCKITELPTMPFTERDRQRYELRPGDLLVCEGGEVGRTAVWRGEISECYFQKAVHRLRPRRNADPRFGLHYMRWATSTGVFRHLTTSTSIAHLTKEKLETAPFPDVPVAEQRRIAAILDEADALRRKRREALVLLDDLLRATFLEMFGDIAARRSPWPWFTCREFVTMSSGKSAKDVLAEGVTSIPVYGGNGINGYATRALFDHPVVVVGRVEQQCGITLMTAGPSWVTDNAIVVHVTNSDQLDPVYLTAALQHAPIRDTVTRLDLPFINQEMLRQQPLPHPPLNVQRRFRAILEAVTAEKARHEEAADLTNNLFSSLLHRAFTGEL